jgi:DNA replication and repair protein RecF
MVWLTPAMDSLFTGAASDRRRFLDRLVLSLYPGYASASSTYERAMRQRNKALENYDSPRLLDAIETQMAIAATEIAAKRVSAASQLAVEFARTQSAAGSDFPWAALSLEGRLEEQVKALSPSETASTYARHLASSRERDRAAGRTLTGPHRSDFSVIHGPKNMPAKMCSSGEQKTLLIGLVLAQARLVKEASGGLAPVILLDEIAAHLDKSRRLALLSSLASLNAQVWMTGTDAAAFAPLRDAASAGFFLVSNGSFTEENDAESGPAH